jgi:hypothetical protein
VEETMASAIHCSRRGRGTRESPREAADQMMMNWDRLKYAHSMEGEQQLAEVAQPID